MGLFRRQDSARRRSPEERAYARAVREARRRGLPEPAPPAPPAPEPVDFDVEPVAARLTEQAAVSTRGHAGPAFEPAAEVIEDDPSPPQGDPLTPTPSEPPEPDESPTPAPPERPHGDPEEEAQAWPEAAADGDGRPAPSPPVARADAPRRGLLRRSDAAGEERTSRRALGRELPPLPPRTAARQPPAPPPRPRSGPPQPPSREPAPRRRPRRWGRRALALVALAIVGVAVAFLVALFQPFHGAGHGVVRLTIPRGASARQIGDLLARRGVVADGRLFSIRAAVAGKRGDFNSGGFTLKRDMSYSAAIAVLTTNPGTAPTINVTIPEGRSRRENAPLVAQDGAGGSYLAATGHPPPPDLGAPRSARTLEGYLFPATYNLPKGRATAKELVADQLAAFRRNFASVPLARARRANLTRYDVLIIASMIEREAQIPRERRLIAAVIYNRLRDGIPLGIDATIRYATGNWTRPLRVSELTRPGPYNLRKHTGLPPTPIGNPGLASLQAAADPAHVPYLYYVVKPGTCGHAFSSTAAQFQRDVQRYNQARARNGGNSPTKC